MTTSQRRGSRAAQSSRPPLRTVKYVQGGNTYVLPVETEVQRIQFNDGPAYVPTSGEQSVKTRPWHNILPVKDIRGCFVHRVELAFEDHHGVYDHVFDSTMDTRWGPIYLAPAENNPSAPAADGTAWICGPGLDQNPDTLTTASLNPKPYRYFQGTTNTAVFLGMIDDVGLGDVEVKVIRWTGTAMTTTATITSTASIAEYLDVEEFQGSLVYLVDDDGVEECHYSTNGSTFAAFSNQPATLARRGSRLKALKGLLWLFAHSGGVTSVEEQTSPTGGAAWTTRSASGLTGKLRDVEHFRDPDGNARIFVLTESGLYYWDETNYEFVQMVVMGTPGRALISARILGKPALIVVQDEGRAFAYFEDQAPLDISPGGEQGMPSGKDLGPSANSQVCVTRGPRFHYFMFSGLDTAGSAFKPMILALDTSKITEADPHAGWHYIWQKADTSLASASRFLFYDPTSGDLVGGVQDATAEDTTLIRFKDIEVSPELQGTWDRQTSGAITLPYLDFGSPIVSTTIWDIFNHSNGMTTNVSLLYAYRTNGSTGAFTNVGSAFTTDNTLTLFPDGTSTGAGLNFRDVQPRITFAGAAATTQVRWLSFDIGFVRIWPVRYLYVIDVVVSGQRGENMPPPETIWTNLDTIAAVTTKGILTYANVTNKNVIPIPESAARIFLNSLGSPMGSPKTGTRRLTLLEA